MDNEVAVWVVAIAGAPGAIALVWAIVLSVRLRRVRADQRILLPDGTSGGVVDRQAALARSLERLGERIDDLRAEVARLTEHTNAGLRGALRFQGIVRYDAYRDMGGQQSWSMAILNAQGEGAIITSLHARDHARVYLKEVVAGRLRPAALPGGGARPRRGAQRPGSVHRARDAAGMRVGYLGPPGTFAEEALLRLVGPEPEQRLVPYATVADCFEAVRSGAVPEALVPIENSIEGSVNQTLDHLAAGAGEVVIRAAIVHPVRHHLVVRPGLTLPDVRRVLSHPHAPPQCSVWLRENLPGVEIVAANSTADAVRIVVESPEPWAAIGPLRAADIYGGEVARGRHRGLPRERDALRAPRAP